MKHKRRKRKEKKNGRIRRRTGQEGVRKTA